MLYCGVVNTPCSITPTIIRVCLLLDVGLPEIAVIRYPRLLVTIQKQGTEEQLAEGAEAEIRGSGTQDQFMRDSWLEIAMFIGAWRGWSGAAPKLARIDVKKF